MKDCENIVNIHNIFSCMIKNSKVEITDDTQWGLVYKGRLFKTLYKKINHNLKTGKFKYTGVL